MADHPRKLPLHGAKTAKDPVCGMQVPMDTVHRYRHEGVDYLFCCAGCRDRFARAPAQFLAPADSAPAAALPAGSAQWTCPMHPEIVRDAPGSCPICGMALEPRSVS